MKSITIGRSKDCDIVLTYDKISRVHANLSLVNGQYIFQDMSRNGSNIGGQIIKNQIVTVAPGTSIWLANKIPLPWDQVYAHLPLAGPYNYNNGNNSLNPPQPDSHQPEYQNSINYQRYEEEGIGFGFGLLAFLIPLAGWIMYFVWKEEMPKKAGQAGLIGTISFIISVLYVL